MPDLLTTYNTLIKETLERYGLQYANQGLGLAMHKVDFDSDKKLFSYTCTEANSDFIKILGVETIEINTLKYEQIFPETKENKFDWKALLGHIGNHQSYAKFYCYSNALNKWCRFVAFSPNKGETMLIAEDISSLKQIEITQNIEKAKSKTASVD